VETSLERARETFAHLLPLIDEAWHLDEHAPDGRFESPLEEFVGEHDQPHFEALRAEPVAGYLAVTRAHLEERWSGAELDERIVEAWATPAALEWPDWRNKNQQRIRRRITVVQVALRALFEAAPTDATIDIVAARARRILSHPYEGAELDDPGTRPPHSCHPPTAAHCLKSLARVDHPRASEHLLAFLRGEWNAPVAVPENMRFSTDHDPPRAYDVSGDAWRCADAARKRLFEVGQLDAEIFETSCREMPESISSFWWADSFRLDDDDDEEDEEDDDEDSWTPPEPGSWKEAQVEHYRDLAWRLAQDPTEENLRLLTRFSATAGARFLLRACELLAERSELKKVKAINKGGSSSGKGVKLWKNALGLLARICRLDPEDDKTVVVRRLAEFDDRVLDIVQPCAGVAQSLVVEAKKARGGKDTSALIELVKDVNKTFRGEYGWLEANGPDPTKGVLDQPSTRPVLEELGEETAAPALRQIVKSDSDARPAVTLLLALMGWNDDEVRRGFTKRNQIAVRAFGLLPLPDGDDGRDECCERYRALQEFRAESRKFGQQRRANEAGAVGAALANLAHTAGYDDPVRLEWDMEARVESQAAETPVIDESPHSIWLDIDAAGGPAIAVEKSGKRMKSIPAAFRKDARITSLKDTVKSLKGQTKRFRAALERLCESGDPIDAAGVEALVALRAACPLVTKLLFRSESGEVGVLSEDGKYLEGLPDADDEPVRVAVEGGVTIVHPLDLIDAGALADWQREIVRRRVVQPLKQAFRELYVLTPAERETGNYSNRFAGQILTTRVASGLLSTRGWTQLSGDYPETFKLFPSAGLRAQLDWADAGHYLTETEFVTTDTISFVPYPAPRGASARGDQRVSLDDVPPRIFSEVMRDADLVVSVAAVSDELYSSNETNVRRAELLLRILDDLGLDNVEIEGHFVRVKGMRARYRVHLASGAIHVEPGGHICVVPDRAAKKATPLYLPFADADDPKLSEVVSKVLLLANDAKIKDPTILEQIGRAD